MAENDSFWAKKGRVGRVNFNLYHYAGNSPVKYTDPDGRASGAPDFYFMKHTNDDIGERAKKYNSDILSISQIVLHGHLTLIKNLSQKLRLSVAGLDNFVVQKFYKVKMETTDDQ